MKKDNRHFTLIDKIFGVLALISVFIFVFHYFSIFVNASSSNNPLPLTNYTSPRYLTDEEITFFNQMIQDKPSMFGNHSVDLNSEGIYCFNVQLDNKIVANRQWASVMGYVFYKPYSYSVGTLSYDSFDLFSSSTVELYFAGFESWQFWQTSPGYSPSYNGWYGAYQSQGNSTTISLFGLGNEVTIQDPYHTNTYTPGYPVYWSTALYNGTSSVPIVNQPLLAYGKPGYQVQEGHATDTGNINSIDNDWNPRPSKPTQPTPTIHTWTPSPPIDTSTIETLLESIHDLLSWLSDNLKDEFSNLISNIGNWFSYLTDLISYFFLSVLDTLNNLKDFLYDNFVSLFEAISNNISYLVEPISATVIYDNISSTSFVSNINTIETSLNSFSGTFQNLSEPSSFTIPIHLENLPSSMFGTLTTQYIDLSVIDPVKTALRTFMWALTTYGLFITIVDSISGYINGGQDE